jgi:hypothetical protein
VALHELDERDGRDKQEKNTDSETPSAQATYRSDENRYPYANAKTNLRVRPRNTQFRLAIRAMEWSTETNYPYVLQLSSTDWAAWEGAVQRLSSPIYREVCIERSTPSTT